MRNVPAIAFVLLAAACNFGDRPVLKEPGLTSGKGQAMPAVIDLRMSGACAGGAVDLSIRFSQPMERSSVQSNLSIAEVLGDVQGEVLPVRDEAVAIDPDSFRWEDGDRQLSFSANPAYDRQYVVNLPAAAANKQQTPLDGLVGPDVNGDGVADIVADAAQYARLDDDYITAPAPFQSLSFYRCKVQSGELSDRHVPENWGNDAPSVWRTPRNGSRPRVLEFSGVLPDVAQPPTYRIDASKYSFGVTDGHLSVRNPLPATGVLRLRIGSPNTSPTRKFAERHDPAPVLPSSLAGNVELFDEDLKEYKVSLYLDNQLRVPAPLVGTADAVGGNAVTSSALASVPDGALAGMWFVARGDKDYLYALPIIGNQGGTLRVDHVLHVNSRVTYDLMLDNELLRFNGSALREREFFGLSAQPVIGGDFKNPVVVSANGGSNVRVIGIPVCAYDFGCTVYVYTELKQMGFLGKSFEIAAPDVFIQSGGRPDNVAFELHVNVAEKPITDIWGRSFVDGLADGNDLKSVADNEWVGRFSSGDTALRPIPPTLQLNDGRYYSPMPTGPTPGAVVDFGTFGRLTYLGLGLYGRTRTLCPGGSPEETLYELGLVFATPDGKGHNLGPEDVLDLATVTTANFGFYRMDGLVPTALGSAVATGTVYLDSYTGGVAVKRQTTTFVRVRPTPAGDTVTDAGADGVCGTGDDRLASNFRRWQAGDRLLISHRVRYPSGTASTLDGNYDGLLSDDVRDDMIFEYQPGATLPFRRAN